ncbi:hypothetical protein GCM10010466_57200 [Planomonospora alba]|uniref:Rod shape-determining protein MreB n=1 Tax=Planomonospora alba TaxID=161354 RepID=A0ABP6NX39_9ACTN
MTGIGSVCDPRGADRPRRPSGGGVPGRGPGGLVRPGSRAALDLGTSRTRLMMSGTLAIVDQPSAVPAAPARDGASGPHDAPDTSDALDALGALGAPEMLRPIRHGMVTSTAACARLARRVLRSAAPHGAPPLERVLLGVPVAASALDRRAAGTAVGSAAGCPVVIVEEPLAAAVGCGVDVTDPLPRLLLDVGAGIIEGVVIRDGAVVDAGAVQIPPGSSGDLPPHVGDQVAMVLAELLARVPANRRRAVRERGLLLTGGGVRRPELARRLCARLGMTVSPALEPAHATVRGLARLCVMPDLLDLLVARQR